MTSRFADYRAVAAIPDVKQSAASQGIDLVNTTSTGFAAFMENELMRWPQVIREGGIKAG